MPQPVREWQLATSVAPLSMPLQVMVCPTAKGWELSLTFQRVRNFPKFCFPLPLPGIGSGKAPLEQCIHLAERPGVRQHWLACQHLIIDEISMVDGKFFDRLEAVARLVSNT